MKFHILHPDGSVEPGECPANGVPRELEHKILGGFTELVSVLYNDKRVHMAVNETGATDAYNGPALQPNARATAIYWTATCQARTPVAYDPLAMPLVHGPAILYEDTLP